MRTFKFRGKNTLSGKWVYGTGIQRYTKGNVYITNESPFGYDVIPESVGQFTGLTDKNGKAIYEGDIIRHKDMVKAYYVVYDGHEFCPNDGFRSLSYPKHWEVIGNIHDNPELLEEKS